MWKCHRRFLGLCHFQFLNFRIIIAVGDLLPLLRCRALSTLPFCIANHKSRPDNYSQPICYLGSIAICSSKSLKGFVSAHLYTPVKFDNNGLFGYLKCSRNQTRLLMKTLCRLSRFARFPTNKNCCEDGLPKKCSLLFILNLRHFVAVRINHKHFRSAVATALQIFRTKSNDHILLTTTANIIYGVNVPFYLLFSCSLVSKSLPLRSLSLLFHNRLQIPDNKWTEGNCQLPKSSTSVFTMADWGSRYYSGSSEENSYYAAPVYGCYSVNPVNSEVRDHNCLIYSPSRFQRKLLLHSVDSLHADQLVHYIYQEKGGSGEWREYQHFV